MGRLDQIYTHLPLFAQHGVVSLYGLYWYQLRFGGAYQQHIADYTERDQFSKAQWHVWQQERLRQVLHTAVHHIPYYRETWDEQEKKAALQNDLTRLPLLEKEPLRQNPTAFLDQSRRVWPQMTFHTSGSTGTPIASIWTIDELRESMALREVRSAGWAGVSFKMARTTFSGRIVEPDPNSTGPFYRFNLVERQAYLSPFHLSPQTAQKYVDALRKHHIKWLTGYAVSYYLLAQYILDQHIDVPPLEAIITTSEKVTAKMREVMEAAFGCPVFEEYSTVENVLFASECESGNLHISPDVAIVEILREDGTPCEPGETGEVVATSLMRQYQPFIRYRLGDVAQWSDKLCACGRGMPILREVIGRIEDVVTGPDGRQMVRFHGIFIDQPNIIEGQIIQERLDHIRVKIVPTKAFNQTDKDDIVRRVQTRLGPDMQVTIETVTTIPRTASGKYKAVVSLIKESR